MTDKATQTKICFVVGPIGEADSETRVHADWLLEEIIEPVFKGFPEFSVIRADKISQPGMIDAQVIRHLIDADLVIADLSMLNPNAFYEIGIRHVIQKPIIHMQLATDRIPFDVSLYRSTKFSRLRPVDLREAREELANVVRSTMSDAYVVDNPVTRAKGQINLEQHATPEQRVLLEQYKSIQSRLDALERKPTTKRRRVRADPEGLAIWFSGDEDTVEKARSLVASKLVADGLFIDMHIDHIFIPGIVDPDGFEKFADIEGVINMSVRES